MDYVLPFSFSGTLLRFPSTGSGLISVTGSSPFTFGSVPSPRSISFNLSTGSSAPRNQGNLSQGGSYLSVSSANNSVPAPLFRASELDLKGYDGGNRNNSPNSFRTVGSVASSPRMLHKVAVFLLVSNY